MRQNNKVQKVFWTLKYLIIAGFLPNMQMSKILYPVSNNLFINKNTIKSYFGIFYVFINTFIRATIQII